MLNRLALSFCVFLPFFTASLFGQGVVIEHYPSVSGGPVYEVAALGDGRERREERRENRQNVEDGCEADMVMQSPSQVPIAAPASEVYVAQSWPAANPSFSGVPAETGSTGVLELEVPADAAVQVNEKAMKLKGPYRRYVYKDMPSGSSVNYKVQVTAMVGGGEGGGEPKKATKTKFVTVKSGETASATFDFEGMTADSSQTGALVLNVPAGATVTLAGQATTSQGTRRIFTSQSLQPEQKWEDYEIKVAFANGTEKTKKITLVGGQSTELSFEPEVVEPEVVAYDSASYSSIPFTAQ